MTTPVNDDETLAAIARYIADEGFAPSLRDLCAAMRLSSVSVASYRIKRLVNRGWITHRRGMPRAISITDAGWSRVAVKSAW